MIWKKEIENLMKKVEDLNFSNRNNKLIETILSDKFSGTLMEYLKLDRFHLSKSQKAWTVVLFLYAIEVYSQGKSFNHKQILAGMSSGFNNLLDIEEAINILLIYDVLTADDSFNQESDFSLETNRRTIMYILDGSPLPELTPEEIVTNRFLIRLINLRLSPDDVFKPSFKNLLDEFVRTHGDIQPLKKLDQIKSIKGDSKYLMTFLVILYIATQNAFPASSEISISTIQPRNELLLQISNSSSRLNKLNYIQSKYLDFLGELRISLSPKALKKFGLEHGDAGLHERTGGNGKTPGFPGNDSSGAEFFKQIPNHKIEAEALHYNRKLTRELDFYKNLFNKEDKIYRENPAVKGKIILMFEGLPGTGKTAAVQQLARESGRDLLHVNWQTFRGQYVGQSEKNLRRLLEDIDDMARHKRRVPIVMFNEAEAFLSQRIAIRQSTDRMENNLVSLLLEWLEKKDPFGIVIFTSNHRQLMDKAFERRISHIAFDMPDESTRRKIWEALLDRFQINLPYDELAARELTGAEIAKVLKTYTLHKIAYNMQNEDPALLHRLCDGQNWLEQKTSIGFKQ